MTKSVVSEDLGYLKAQVVFIVSELADAKASRKETHQVIADFRTDMSLIKKDMVEVKETLNEHGPTIKEFLEIKQKVSGAGNLGKLLWVAGIALITTVYNFREGLMSWLK